MNSNDLLGTVVAALLGGGIWQGISSLRQGGAMARKLKAETNALGAESAGKVDSIVVQGAETAVLTLERALAASERGRDRAEAKNIEYERKVAALQTQLDNLQDALNAAREQLSDLLSNP